MSKPRALENHLLLLKDKKCVILTNLDKTSWQKTAKFGVSNENEEWHRRMVLPSGLDSTAGQQWALVLYYIISFQCVQKTCFPFVQEFSFLTWNLCIFYKDTLYELDKCFLQVLVIPECALLELQHCRPSNWPGFALKQRPLPLPLVPASSKPAVERTILFGWLCIS